MKNTAQILLEMTLRILTWKVCMKILDSFKSLKMFYMVFFYSCVCVEVIATHSVLQLQLFNCGKQEGFKWGIENVEFQR